MLNRIVPRFFIPRRSYSESISTTIPYFQFDEGVSTEAFSEIIDVRTPSEYLEDHIPNAINLPVLSEDERVEVGTIFSKHKLMGRKHGASLISANISRHLQQHFSDKPLADKHFSDKPLADKHFSNKPLADKHLTNKHVSDKPLADKHFSEKHFSDKPLADKHFSDKPLADKHFSDKPLADKYFSDKPLADKHFSEKHFSDKALADKHLSEKPLADKPCSHKPLIYCWRGGQRSRSLALILKEIGFDPTLVKFGYKGYRKHVRDYFYSQDCVKYFTELKILLISGSTGCGKSKILEALEERGEQVLHLEEIAKHKGSILGQYPNEEQPNQKLFETNLMKKLKTFNLDQVVWVENESVKIGQRTIPNNLWSKMLVSSRVHVEVDLKDRVEFVLKDYEYFLSQDSQIKDLLFKLKRHSGEKKYEKWINLVEKSDFRELVKDLIVNYYDISYKKPRGTPIQVVKMEEGLLMDQGRLINSRFISDIIEEGVKFRSSCDKLCLDKRNIGQCV